MTRKWESATTTPPRDGETVTRDAPSGKAPVRDVHDVTTKHDRQSRE